MIDAAVGRVNRHPAHGGPGGTGAVERVADDKIICLTSAAEATVRPGYIDRPRSIDLG